MKSIDQLDGRDDILHRIEKLSVAHVGLWGKMNVVEMMAHLNDAFRASMGMKSVRGSVPSWLHWPARLLFLHCLPWPPGLPAPPEFQSAKKGSKPKDFDTEKAFLKTMIDIFSERSADKLTPHPIFGKMNKYDYGKLLYKHVDHHLRQFGV